MLSTTQKEKSIGVYWDDLLNKPGSNSNKIARQRATFNKNMRQKLKQRIRDLSDLVLLLQNLPPQVLENAKLEEDVWRVIEFVDVFLEKTSPLPVGMNDSGKKMVFRNTAKKINDHPNSDGLEKMGWLINIDGDKYIVDSDYWLASPTEVYNWETLKNHSEKLRRYIDPTIASVGKQPLPEGDIVKMIRERGRLLEDFELHSAVIKPREGFPIVPPNQPCIIDETK